MIHPPRGPVGAADFGSGRLDFAPEGVLSFFSSDIGHVLYQSNTRAYRCAREENDGEMNLHVIPN